MNRELLRMEDIIKVFSGNVVLNRVNVSVKEGEVYALMGENGSGKSTLARIASGVIRAEHGRLYYKEHLVKIPNPTAARKLGIEIIHQEPEVVLSMNVMQNMFLGREIRRSNGALAVSYMYAEAKQIFKRLKVDIDVYSPMYKLNVANRHIVLIAKALISNPKLLIMDEVTAAFSKHEFDVISNVIKQLKKNNVSVVFISHKISEVKDVADRVGILCDGILVGEYNVNLCDKDMLIKLMTAGAGEERKSIPQKEKERSNREIMRLENVNTESGLQNISFSLMEGEVLGVAGLVGSGRTRLMNFLFGLSKKTSGAIYIKGERVDHYNSDMVNKYRIGILPEERIDQGLFANMNVGFNITMAALNRCGKMGIIKHKNRQFLAEHFVRQLNIKTNGLEQSVMNLSGGNQQKTLIGRQLALKADIMIMDEPTKGIDLTTKAEILALIGQFSKEGKSIIIVSTEVSELFEVCDRILVMQSGTIVQELGRESFKESELLSALVN